MDPSADQDLVAAAYRVRAKKLHPDVHPNPDADQRMAELNAAGAILRHPVKREAWDREHLLVGGTGHTSTEPAAAARHSTGSPNPPSSSGSSGTGA